jgi:DNA-binding winged helix-turn-helix (wHTH) protein
MAHAIGADDSSGDDDPSGDRSGIDHALREVLAFGPFRLDRVQHVLRKSGKPLRMGGRALEILLVLVEQPGATVSKTELLERVWTNGVVEEGTMRVHIAALRRILGDDESGIPYVQNVSGRGYRFAAHVARVRELSPDTVAPASCSSVQSILSKSSSIAGRARNFPGLLRRMLGRSEAFKMLAARIPQQRLVTITGPGGIGKTTLALHLADTLAPSFPQGMCLVDLALLREPRGVPSALASALGLEGLAGDCLREILSFLRDESMLVVLDTCEHVIEVVANLAGTILQSAPRCAFSRHEPRIAGRRE